MASRGEPVDRAAQEGGWGLKSKRRVVEAGSFTASCEDETGSGTT